MAKSDESPEARKKPIRRVKPQIHVDADGNLLDALKRVVPFLFGEKEPQKSLYKSPSIIVRTPDEERRMQHAARRIARRRTVAQVGEKTDEKTAESASPVTGERVVGKIVTPEKDEPAANVDVKELEEEGGWMKRALHKRGQSKEKRAGMWSIIRDRFFKRIPKEKKTVSSEIVPETAILDGEDETVAPKERAQSRKDSSVLEQFALGDEEKNEKAQSRPQAREETEAPETVVPAKRSTGTILPASNTKMTTKEMPEEETVVEKMKTEEVKKEEGRKREEEKKKQETAEKQIRDKKRKHVTAQKKSGFSQFLSAIGHIGLKKERALFVQNLATMLNAGLPLIDALRTLKLETRVKPMKKLIQRILDTVENGSPLWKAMDDQNFFSLHALALVRIGEEAGNLAQNMEYLALQEEKDNALRSKVKMAMIYPTIVIVIMFLIVMGLGMFVLPNLIGVLFSLNVPLPFITRMVILFTNMFTEYGSVAVPSMIGGMIMVVLLAKFTSFKVVTQWVMFKVPGVGRLAREATIARFGVILGGLLKAGVPVIEAMQSLVDVTPIMSYRKLYARMLDHIAVGYSFSKSFETIKGSMRLLPASVQQLVITGERSGSLADIMLKIADIYDKKASDTAQKLPIILEPMLLLIIGGLVGTIAFAIIVPIYSIVGSVGR